MKTPVQKGKEERFKEIYSISFDRLYKIFLRSLKSEELVHDILQEAYIKLWFRLDDLNTEKDYMSFLFFHARNHARKEINTRIKREELQLKLNLSVETSDMESELDKKEYHALLCRVIDDLPPKRQQVYRLFNEEGLSYKKIAELLDISSKTVDNHLNEATKTIKRKISNSYGLKNLLILLISLICRL